MERLCHRVGATMNGTLSPTITWWTSAHTDAHTLMLTLVVHSSNLWGIVWCLETLFTSSGWWQGKFLVLQLHFILSSKWQVPGKFYLYLMKLLSLIIGKPDATNLTMMCYIPTAVWPMNFGECIFQLRCQDGQSQQMPSTPRCTSHPERILGRMNHYMASISKYHLWCPLWRNFGFPGLLSLWL